MCNSMQGCTALCSNCDVSFHCCETMCFNKGTYSSRLLVLQVACSIGKLQQTGMDGPVSSLPIAKRDNICELNREPLSSIKQVILDSWITVNFKWTSMHRGVKSAFSSQCCTSYCQRGSNLVSVVLWGLVFMGVGERFRRDLFPFSFISLPLLLGLSCSSTVL